MALDIPTVRPAVIDTDLAGTPGRVSAVPARLPQRLWGRCWSAGRMRSLEARMPATLEAFRNQIRSFLAWMLGGE